RELDAKTPDAKDKTTSSHIISAQQEGEILRIETLTGDGDATPIVETGDDLIIRIHYRANIPIERPAFGIGIFRDDGLHITGPNTYVAGYQIDEVEGPGYIDYVVEKMPLLTGRYFISASMYNEEHTYRYDYVHEIHSFVVQPRTVWDQLGVVKLPARWQLRQESSSATGRWVESPSSAGTADDEPAQEKANANVVPPTEDEATAGDPPHDDSLDTRANLRKGSAAHNTIRNKDGVKQSVK
ncbi:MAG: Wzt carbohydrate-binding domain-containing protein, partial [Caldilineaceae bacterium]|nr:Wzt carbohydrate-binding domain-containing protein [Caldilineaceae bacterium]